MPASSQAVVLAGGKGTRLAPSTTVLPKPLLPIGNRAILEVVVEQLAASRFTDLTFAVGYLPHLIEAVFRDGRGRGVSISYHREASPTGTAGVLADLRHLDEPFLMMNGDVLTSLDYRELYDAHCQSGNALTVATHRRTIRSDYGVLHLDGELAGTRRVVGWQEKPEHSEMVSMGVYIVDPSVCDHVEDGVPVDLPDVVKRLLDAGEQVGSYEYDGLWLDIGRHDDYELAVSEYEKLVNTPVPHPVADLAS
jgi:NDP-sugar pyrophosphorylase family protein